MPWSSTGLVPVRLFGRRRWRAKDARAILKRLAASGLAVREFAARHGLDAQRLYRWRAQFASVEPASVSPAAFVEVKPLGSAALEVVVRSGHVIRVPDGFSEETLRRAVAVLDALVTPC